MQISRFISEDQENYSTSFSDKTSQNNIHGVSHNQAEESSSVSSKFSRSIHPTPTPNTRPNSTSKAVWLLVQDGRRRGKRKTQRQCSEARLNSTVRPRKRKRGDG
ncbi:Hypothetical predicted protein [Xyrichtys novacula]|uniref:Uncharacterized protein n=1 Tax=Xyrichtys novacula TaxID=13765 RepID=A0AAV1GGN7_XYRNO|nr:Hypothetical predicted protein [Xyrichtys novacula]